MSFSFLFFHFLFEYSYEFIRRFKCALFKRKEDGMKEGNTFSYSNRQRALLHIGIAHCDCFRNDFDSQFNGNSLSRQATTTKIAKI